MSAKISRGESESVLDFRLRLHAELADHVFVQDPADIPGGCKTCWDRFGMMDEEA